MAKSWVEEVETFYGKTKVTHIQTVCADPACQKIVEAHMAEKIAKSEQLQRDHEERLEQMKTNRASASKANKTKPSAKSQISLKSKKRSK